MSKQQLRQQLFEEFEYKEKAGTAWSHNYLNQKPWHPLSYPNQRRKWIAEQMHGMQGKRLTEVEKEFAKEQELLRQSALLSKKQREKVEAMQSVSFLYTKPPGYNAESARAAELAEEQRRQQEQEQQSLPATSAGEGLDAMGAAAAGALVPAAAAATAAGAAAADEALILAKAGPMGGTSSAGAAEEGKKKPAARDVFGRKIVTGEDFEILKNAPRMDTGIVGRARPFGVELRNVRCGRCGAMGHQSGDRDCPLKDALTPADAQRQQREDPLSLILAQNRSEKVCWELKQTAGGMSPPRGGFSKEDANQQILAPDDDEGDGHGVLGTAVGRADGYGESDEERLPGVSKAVYDSLTKQQRKELRRALRKEQKREKKEKRRRRRRADGSSNSESEEMPRKKHRRHRKVYVGSSDEGGRRERVRRKSRDEDEGNRSERRRKHESQSDEERREGGGRLKLRETDGGQQAERRKVEKHGESSGSDYERRPSKLGGKTVRAEKGVYGDGKSRARERDGDGKADHCHDSSPRKGTVGEGSRSGGRRDGESEGRWRESGEKRRTGLMEWTSDSRGRRQGMDWDNERT